MASSDDRQTEEIGGGRPTAEGVDEDALLEAGARLRQERYVLQRLLGRGGMAGVWLARDERLERAVAIKVLSRARAADSQYLTRFRREARLAAGLSHPSLVRVFDYGAERGRPYLVMEYVSGGDLGERLAVNRPPDPDRLAHELLGALVHIHAAGVLHRDVKAKNVLLDREGCARLTDFGIAQDRDATVPSRDGAVLGTAPYMAPEVLGGEPPSERSDLYSLGVLLSEVGTARAPSPRLSELIVALRSREPGGRPASAAEALEALEPTESAVRGPAVLVAAGAPANGGG